MGGETWLLRTMPKLCCRIIARLSDVPVQTDTGDFRLLDRKRIPSLIAVLLFVSGIQLMILGILGGYLGRVFIEAKGRPVYLVGEVKAGRDGCNDDR